MNEEDYTLDGVYFGKTSLNILNSKKKMFLKKDFFIIMSLSHIHFIQLTFCRFYSIIFSNSPFLEREKIQLKKLKIKKATTIKVIVKNKAIKTQSTSLKGY